MYKLNQNSTCITRQSDGASIPADPKNTDYADYLRWVESGNSPDPADPLVVVIAPITPRQMRMALTRAGLRAAVENAVAAGDQDLKDWWEFSNEFERNRPQVIAMAAALGVSPSSVDQLWALGATL